MNQTWARLLHIAQVPPILCFRVGGNCPGFVYIPRLHTLPGLLGWPRRGRVNSPHYTAEALRFFRSPLRQELSFCVLTPAQDPAQPCVALPAYWLEAYGSSGILTPARLPHVSVLRIAPRVLRRHSLYRIRLVHPLRHINTLSFRQCSPGSVTDCITSSAPNGIAL